MSFIQTMTGAGGIISAAHRSKDGAIHGHTWEVTAWWTGLPDVVKKQSALTDLLQHFDHTVLEHELGWAENLAAEICQQLDCQKVDVSRPLERLYATAIRQAKPQGADDA